MADDRGGDTDEVQLDTVQLDTAALLDQGEQLLAESARLLRRLDEALRRRAD